MTEETEPVVEETTTEETESAEETEPVYTGKYCNSDDVLALFEDISDTPSAQLLERVILNAESWIETRLKKSKVPIPTVIPDSFETIAVYYAASDILMTLYHGEDYQTLRNYWFNNAQELLDDYIDEYWNYDAEEDEIIAHNVVGHRKAMTYNQKRGRVGLWAR